MSALQLCRLKAPQLPANSYSFMAVRAAPSFAGILQTPNLDASKLCRDWKLAPIGRNLSKSKHMTQTNHAKVIILGSGPAGWTAAVYAARRQP